MNPDIIQQAYQLSTETFLGSIFWGALVSMHDTGLNQLMVLEWPYDIQLLIY